MKALIKSSNPEDKEIALLVIISKFLNIPECQQEIQNNKDYLFQAIRELTPQLQSIEVNIAICEIINSLLLQDVKFEDNVILNLISFCVINYISYNANQKFMIDLNNKNQTKITKLVSGTFRKINKQKTNWDKISK